MSVFEMVKMYSHKVFSLLTQVGGRSEFIDRDIIAEGLRQLSSCEGEMSFLVGRWNLRI